MLGQRIRNRRIDLGLSQDELAKLTGYDNRASISKIESGLIDMNVSKIKVFAKALNVSESYLMGWEENITEPEFDDDMVVLARGAKTLTKEQKKLIKNMIDEFNKNNED